MLEKQIKIILDSYFRKALLRATFTSALIVGIIAFTLLCAITAIINHTNHAWLIVIIFGFFWLTALLCMRIALYIENKKLERTTKNSTRPQWLAIILELSINYLINKNSD